MSPSARALVPGQFLGSTVGRGELGAFRWTEIGYAPELQLDEHTHELSYVSCVLAGSYVERSGSDSRHCGPRSVLLHPACEEHADRFESRGGRILNVELPRDWVAAAGDRSSLLARPAQLHDDTAAALALRIRRELRETDDVSALMCEGLLLELLAHGARDAARAPRERATRWLEPVAKRLRARPLRAPRPIDLARSLGVPPARLSREFRRFTGTSPSQFRAARGGRSAVQARRDVQDARRAPD